MDRSRRFDAPATSPCDDIRSRFLEASYDLPMPDSLPHRSKDSRDHEVVEEVLENNRRTLQIIPVHVDGGYRAYYPTCGYKQHPIPLPSSADRMKSFLVGQKQSSVFPQIGQCEHHRGSEETCKHDAQASPLSNAVVRVVAGRGIDKSAVGE